MEEEEEEEKGKEEGDAPDEIRAGRPILNTRATWTTEAAILLPI